MGAANPWHEHNGYDGHHHRYYRHHHGHEHHGYGYGNEHYGNYRYHWSANGRTGFAGTRPERGLC
jgi:hypothetical protein